MLPSLPAVGYSNVVYPIRVLISFGGLTLLKVSIYCVAACWNPKEKKLFIFGSRWAGGGSPIDFIERIHRRHDGVGEIDTSIIIINNNQLRWRSLGYVFRRPSLCMVMAWRQFNSKLHTQTPSSTMQTPQKFIGREIFVYKCECIIMGSRWMRWIYYWLRLKRHRLINDDRSEKYSRSMVRLLIWTNAIHSILSPSTRCQLINCSNQTKCCLRSASAKPNGTRVPFCARLRIHLTPTASV